MTSACSTSKRFLHGAIVLVVLSLTHPAETSAHPWGGLVVDSEGNIYFTFVCPFTSDDHFACIWKISGDNVSASLESSRSPSDIILARTADRTVFGAERTGPGEGHWASLWQYQRDNWELIVEPTQDKAHFHIQSFTVDGDGNILFAVDDNLFVRDTQGSVRPLSFDNAFERIDAMAWGPGEALYILDRGRLYDVSIGTGAINLIANGLREESPEDLPFSGANIIFDMALDEDGAAYLAYYGNRRILKVTPSGETSTFIRSEAPWSPHGIDYFDGEVYILESTVGEGPWWKSWGRPVIVPRIRKISGDGNVSIIFEYREDQ